MVLTATDSRRQFHTRYPDQPKPSQSELQSAKARNAREAKKARQNAKKKND